MKKKLYEIFSKIKAQNIVISNEKFLDLWNAENCIPRIKLWHTLLNQFNVKFIIYVRRFDSYAESIYKERMLKKSNFTLTFNDFYENEFKETITNLRLSIKLLSELFGSESIILRKFEKESFVKGNLSTDFLNQIGINEHTICDKEVVENTGISLNISEALRHYKLYLIKNKNATL